MQLPKEVTLQWLGRPRRGDSTMAALLHTLLTWHECLQQEGPEETGVLVPGWEAGILS